MASAHASRARWQATFAWIGSVFLWHYRPCPITVVVAAVATTLALLSWLLPKSYAPVQRGFDWITRTLRKGLTWLLLVLVYFGLFTPLRVWRALSRSDPLRLRADPGVITYLRPLPPAAPDRFDRQF